MPIECCGAIAGLNEAHADILDAVLKCHDWPTTGVIWKDGKHQVTLKPGKKKLFSEARRRFAQLAAGYIRTLKTHASSLSPKQKAEIEKLRGKSGHMYGSVTELYAQAGLTGPL